MLFAVVSTYHIAIKRPHWLEGIVESKCHIVVEAHCRKLLLQDGEPNEGLNAIRSIEAVKAVCPEASGLFSESSRSTIEDIPNERGKQIGTACK